MAKFNLYLDTRVEKKGGLYNLTIRVNVGNEQFFLIISKMTIVQHHNIFVKTSMDKASIEFRETCTLYINKCEKIYRIANWFSGFLSFSCLYNQTNVSNKLRYYPECQIVPL